MKHIFTLLVIGIILVVYRPWMIAPEIVGGDWPYFSDDFLKQLPFVVPSWASYQVNGFGGPSLTYALDSYLSAVSFHFVRILSLPWPIVSKGAYFLLFLSLAYSSARYFLVQLLPKASWWQRDIASLLYTTNTFMLMIAGGGQMGVTLAIAGAPFALGSSILLTHAIGAKTAVRLHIRRIITTSLCYGLLTLFDVRIAFLVFGAHALYILAARARSLNSMMIFIVITMGIVGIIVALLHASWILPMIAYRFTPYDYLLTKVGGRESFEFFSFATFSNGLSLLHPNWSENIFGKVYFMRPEFLVIPIIGFISLLSVLKIRIDNQKEAIQQYNNRTIFYTALLVLVGVFFAKGAQEPFGMVNSWLFENIPGLSLLRDPTKYYLYILLGYLVLIPAGLSQLMTILRIYLPRAKPATILSTVLIVFVGFWGFSVRDALLGRLGGTFRLREVPAEYRELSAFLSSQTDFFRTLWYPRQQRFSYYTNLHPAVEANHFFSATDSAELLRRVSRPNALRTVQAAGIKYVIVPYDSESEIFIRDRKYDDAQWQQAVNTLDGLPWLGNKQRIGNITLYEVPDPFGRFSVVRNGDIVDRQVANTAHGTTRYAVDASGSGTLVFNERFNPSWKANVGGTTLPSIRTGEGYNSFVLQQGREPSVDVYFDQENVYTYGRFISLVTGIILLVAWVAI